MINDKEKTTALLISAEHKSVKNQNPVWWFGVFLLFSYCYCKMNFESFLVEREKDSRFWKGGGGKYLS